jgi:hypothetical protein
MTSTLPLMVCWLPALGRLARAPDYCCQSKSAPAGCRRVFGAGPARRIFYSCGSRRHWSCRYRCCCFCRRFYYPRHLHPTTVAGAPLATLGTPPWQVLPLFVLAPVPMLWARARSTRSPALHRGLRSRDRGWRRGSQTRLCRCERACGLSARDSYKGGVYGYRVGVRRGRGGGGAGASAFTIVLYLHGEMLRCWDVGRWAAEALTLAQRGVRCDMAELGCSAGGRR